MTATLVDMGAHDRRADKDADFSAYMAARQAALYRTAYLLAGDHATAEDLLQNAFAKLYLSWDKVRDREAPATERQPQTGDAVLQVGDRIRRCLGRVGVGAEGDRGAGAGPGGTRRRAACGAPSPSPAPSRPPIWGGWIGRWKGRSSTASAGTPCRAAGSSAGRPPVR